MCVLKWIPPRHLRIIDNLDPTFGQKFLESLRVQAKWGKHDTKYETKMNILTRPAQ